MYWVCPIRPLKVRLIRLYNILVRSIVDYGSLIYGTAANTHLRTIDRIQYAGIRIAVGAIKSTPVQLLEPEADIIPLISKV